MPSPTSHIISLISSGADATRRQAARAVDVGMRHGSARVWLERERLDHPAFAEISGQCARSPPPSYARSAWKKPVRALEHRARPDEAVPCQQRCAQARLRRPAGMQALGPGALGEIFDDPGRHAAGDAERIDDLAPVAVQRGATAGRGRHGTQHRGRVEAGLVHQPAAPPG